MSSPNYKPVSRNQQHIARSRSHEILCSVQCILREKGYKMHWKNVGSGYWGTVIEDSNGKYDLDYQILLTDKSKCIKEKHSPKNIKKDFFEAFDKSKNDDERLENSTTAITLKNDNKTGKRYSVDFVIIKESTNEIIRRCGENEYVWNKLPQRFDESYNVFESMSQKDKQNILDRVMMRKNLEKRKQKGKSSFIILIEEINNYANSK